MTLGQLLERTSSLAALDLVAPLGAADRARAVAGVEFDSRRVVAGSVFVGMKGEKADGAVYAQQALIKGACAVVAEAPAPAGWTLPWVRVADDHAALAALAAVFYGHPSDDLLVVGITGTNGKTTTSYLTAGIFDEGGVRCGRLGTVSYDVGGIERDAPRTTPEATDFQRMLREMATNGCGACAAEVSSHALVLKRVDHVRFAAGVFTNLTRDHLDFHHDMGSYFAAKRRLFELLPAGATAAVNVDDPYGRELAGSLKKRITFGIAEPADVNAGPFDLSLDGVSFEIQTSRGSIPVRSTLPGRPNVSNILAAAAVAIGLDLPHRAIQQGIARVERVPGRFERVSRDTDDVCVVVDYAHTDDALKNLLETVRPMAKGRLITVFGCGGERDRSKRPLMGAVAARMSDLVVLTSDNPRGEDPQTILDEIVRGIVPPGDRPAMHHGQVLPPIRVTPHLSIVDRGAAIERAVREAKAGDTILIAGKGHEKYQVIGDKSLPFDDVAVSRAALDRRGSKSVSMAGRNDE
jgi:UDP-N-acetylmuramoyl-L-alanyl-D-glutamate--2,6-diaminopimelate ligase